MSMTKHFISSLQERAAQGDADAIETLTSAGLYETESQSLERAAWEEIPDDDSEFDNEGYLDDCYADGEALASAGYGLDEDYGSFDGDYF